MRIGIDATALPAKPAGAGTYTIYLIRELLSIDTDFEFVIFAQRSGRGLINLSSKDNLNWVTITDRKPALRLLWEQFVLPVLVQRQEIDLLHSLHYTRPIYLSGRHQCISVVTFHDMTFFLYPHLHTWTKRIFFPLSIRLSAKLADGLIAVSENTRKDAIRLLGIPRDKIYTTPLGVHKCFKPISDQRLLVEIQHKHHLPKQFILHVGTIEPRKNLVTLVRAFSIIVKMGYTGSLVVVGQMGWMFDELLQVIKALGIEDKIQFSGYIPASDLPIVYNLAQIFVYPSTYEGFGFPPLEAMACGIPVITTSVSAMADYIGDAGMLVSPQNEDHLAQAMHNLLNDKKLQEQLSIKGQQRASSFTWIQTAQETIKVYQHVQSGR